MARGFAIPSCIMAAYFIVFKCIILYYILVKFQKFYMFNFSVAFMVLAKRSKLCLLLDGIGLY